MKIRFPFVLLASLLVALLAVSHDSLWIDEAFSARYAAPPDFAAWWRTLLAGGPPDLQDPLYMFFLWAWEKLAGSSEWALRAANIPWFLLAQAAFWVGLRRWPRLQLAAVICGACNPFLWRYLDEARPYAMQYSGAAVVVSSLAWLAAASVPTLGAGWLFAFGGGLFVLCGSCALGVPWAIAAALAFVCLAWPRVRIAWSFSTVAAGVASVLALGSLAAYFAWSAKFGHGGESGYGHRLGSLCFAAYELLGFGGLGPSRIAVTEEHNLGIFIPFVGILALFAILLAGSLVIAARALVRQTDFRRLMLAAAIYLLLPLSLLVGLVFRSNWHAVGRHFTPASPVVVLCVALAVAAAWRESSRWRIAWTSALLLLWAASCLEVRFAARHRRDDYRDAVHVALAVMAHGKHVWWAASDVAGDYYHLPTTHDPTESSRAFFVFRPSMQDIANLPPPDAIFFSKAPIFDTTGALTAYVRTHQYRLAGELPAFSIWEKSGNWETAR